MNDASLLRDARDCDQECHLADGETIKLTQVGSVVLTVLARGQQQDVTLTDVYLAPESSCNIMFYGKLELKGFGLVYDGESRVLPRRSNGQVAFDVAMKHNVLYVQKVAAACEPRAPSAVLMAILTSQAAPEDPESDTQTGRCCTFTIGLGISRTTPSSVWR